MNIRKYVHARTGLCKDKGEHEEHVLRRVSTLQFAPWKGNSLPLKIKYVMLDFA